MEVRQRSGSKHLRLVWGHNLKWIALPHRVPDGLYVALSSSYCLYESQNAHIVSAPVVWAYLSGSYRQGAKLERSMVTRIPEVDVSILFLGAFLGVSRIWVVERLSIARMITCCKGKLTRAVAASRKMQRKLRKTS